MGPVNVYVSYFQGLLTLWAKPGHGEPLGWVPNVAPGAEPTDYAAAGCRDAFAPGANIVRTVDRFSADWGVELRRREAAARKAKRARREELAEAQSLIPIPADIEDAGRREAIDYRRRVSP